MRPNASNVLVLCFVLLALAAGTAAEAQPPSDLGPAGRYTAQRRPRVAVYGFEDTNTVADSSRYGSSVQAMLVTFLKRKSQFVVVERQRLKDVLDEWQLNQKGDTDLQLDDPEAQELLKYIDVILLGSVTLLDGASASEARPAATACQKKPLAGGPRIEIDAKLLSRADGRIIAAAQRSGPVACLRSIVERLGVALEQEFLRPFYGKLTFTLTDPENVQVFLSPILLDTALDEEKPPAERSATVRIDASCDAVTPWVTDRTSYAVENLLSGWYTVRLERPGYEWKGIDTDVVARRDVFGNLRIFERDLETGKVGKRLEMPKDEKGLSGNSRFVVRVPPLGTEVVNGDVRSFTFTQEVGSLAPRAGLEYLQIDRPPQRARLEAVDLVVNRVEIAKEYTDDASCDFFEEHSPTRPDGDNRITVAPGQPLDVRAFKGGQLVIEDYRAGIVVPAGRYRLTMEEPHYRTEWTEVVVYHGDHHKKTLVAMNRETRPLELTSTGPKRENKVWLQGRDTQHRLEVPLDFGSGKRLEALPVDVYTVGTDVPGLAGWHREVDLFADVAGPRSLAVPVEALSAEAPEAPSATAGRTAARIAASIPAHSALALDSTIAAGPVTGTLTTTAVAQGATAATDAPGAVASTATAPASQVPPPPPAHRVHVKSKLVLAGSDCALGWLDPFRDEAHVDSGLDDMLASLYRDEDEEEAVKGRGWFHRLFRLGDDALRVRCGPADGIDPEEILVAADRAAQLALIERRLGQVDLLVLDDEDTAGLRRTPDLAEVVARWLDSGGALFAFVAEKGDYGAVLRAPLLAQKGRRTARFNLAPAAESDLAVPAMKKKVKVKSGRRLARLERLGGAGRPWRVLAVDAKRGEPRIVERGLRDRGGYVLVWVDRPESFRGLFGGMVPEVEAVRAEVEQRVLDWARYLMYRRYDSAGTERQRVEQTLSH